jgi:uncharacterized protein
MSHWLRHVASLSACLLTIPAAAHARQAAGAERAIGTWQAVLVAGTARIRLTFVVGRDVTGGLRGTMRSPDQGDVEAPAIVAVRGDTLSFTIAASHITYSGVMTASGDSVRGTFVQGASVPLSFGRSTGGAAGATAPVARPQDPKPPYPYRTEEVAVPSEGGVQLAGTVVMPEGQGPFPAVVFVTGSGPQDRDETLLGHRPFRVIADYLARHGIASLRYDDRGFAKSTGIFETATSADFANDAEAALHFLQHVPGIARDRVGIIGHSEGGLIGPMIAARTRDVAFLVLMAGPGMPGDSLSLLQLRRLLSPSGVATAELDARIDNNRRILHAISSARDSADAVARLMAVTQEILAAMPEDQRPAAASRFDQSRPQLLGPWMRYFLRYDSRTALRNVHVPVLALGGTLDLQVPASENLSGIDAALKAAGNKDYRVVELPNLNHLFQTAATGAPSEYATIEETVAPAVLDLIASWINQRFPQRPAAPPAL